MADQDIVRRDRLRGEGRMRMLSSARAVLKAVSFITDNTRAQIDR